MDEGILGILVIAGFICGVIGMFLGSSVNKGGAGFFLGLFLGPIGWIIVLLLPRETSNSSQTQTPTPTQKPKERPPRDLTNNKYKIWLGKKHEINRNELFDQFECDGELFESLDAALKFADELEAKSVEAEMAEQAQKAAAGPLELEEQGRLAVVVPSLQKKQNRTNVDKIMSALNWNNHATRHLPLGGYKVTSPSGETVTLETFLDLQKYYDEYG
jgi:hypothetical protein